MLDIRDIEANPEKYKKSLQMRKADASVIDTLLNISKERRAKIQLAEESKAFQNKVSDEIAAMRKNKQNADDKIAEMRDLGSKIKNLMQEAEQSDLRQQDILLGIPNLLDERVPQGSGEEDNELVRTYGEKRSYSFTPVSHDALGEKLNILDFERAAKVTGTRFTFLRAGAALLERALINFMLDLHTQKHGYEEMMPPLMVNDSSMQGTGQFPKFRDDVFHLENMPYHLIPTAEVPVTNYFAGEILNEDFLPKQFAAYTPCFRSEAGSHGRDTKGLIRQHQFNKVELVQFCTPSQSVQIHEQLTAHAEEILKQLDLHYQVVKLCSGDIGFGASICYDINVWLPGQNAYREISSCSNFKDFQARRANIRYRPKDGGKPQYVHTLNGSGLAVGRTLIAILENYQQADGSVLIPKVLQKYTNGMTQIKA